MSSVSTSGSGAPKSSFSFGRIWDQYGMLVVFAVLFIACAIFVPNFATFINMKGLGLAISMSGMVACGMLFCLASGEPLSLVAKRSIPANVRRLLNWKSMCVR